MRTLVVGGTGLVGLGVVRALREAGRAAVVAHRGRARAVLPAGTELEHLDRNAGRDLHDAIERLRPDAVVDLTCYDAADAHRTVAACAGIERVVVVSSVNVFGGPIPRPLRNAAEPAPVSNYGRDKLAAESVIAAAWRSGESRAVVVRLGPCYRAGCYLDGQLMEDAYWLGQLTAGERALLADEGEALWNLLHADDAGRAIVALLENTAHSCTVLVGSRQPLAWRRLYELVHDRLGAQFDPLSLPADWVRERLPGDDFLWEMSMWDQVYDLSPLERLAPSYEEREPIAERVCEAAAWLVAAGQPGSAEALERARRLATGWSARHPSAGGA